jgi:futalosine hydrolase
VTADAVLVDAATAREVAAVERAETLVCGIGPVEAALATAAALAGRRPRAVVHVGIAGAQSLAPASLVLGSEAVYCDVVDPQASLPRVTRVEPDPQLLAAARQALSEASVLPIGTCGRVGGGTSCAVEAMEGFAVLRAAELVGVPAVELRAISNRVEEADRRRWRVDEALEALRDATARLLAELDPR